MSSKVILTCAVTGASDFNRRHPSFPVTTAQIAAAAIEAAQAGASVVHLHVRDPETGLGNNDPALFRELVERVRGSGVDVVLNLTCGGYAGFYPDPEDESRAGPGSDIAPAEVRVRHIVENRPDIASLDVTTANQVEAGMDLVYLNTPRTLRAMAERFREVGVKPELEIFHPGDILLARKMLEDGLFEAPPLFQFVLGVSWCNPASAETIIYLRSLLPPGAIWAAFGIGREQMPMVAQSVLLGGHARVGLEDNLYLERGVFASNGQLVERARSIIENMGSAVATPGETRAMLSLGPKGTASVSSVDAQ